MITSRTIRLLLLYPLFLIAIATLGFTQPCSVSLGADTSFCLGDSIILDPGPGWTAITWQNLSNTQTQIVSRSGTYWVMVVDSNGCDAEDTIEVEVFDLPKPRFLHVADSLGNVDFTDITMNPVGWFWDFGDGNASTQQNPSHTYASSGTYNVCLTVVNQYSCAETRCETLTVSVPQTGLMERMEPFGFQCWPVPARDRLWMKLNWSPTFALLLDPRGSSFQLTNLDQVGEKIWEVELPQTLLRGFIPWSWGMEKAGWLPGSFSTSITFLKERDQQQPLSGSQQGSPPAFSALTVML